MDFLALDKHVIVVCRKNRAIAARVALAIIFVWFGSLKLFGLSPATPLVFALYQKTLWFIPFDGFYAFFGTLEVLIGALFLVPKATRIVVALLVAHMVTTMLPLIFVPAYTWSAPFVPTLEGQYIIKNLVIIAAALGLVGDLKPFSHVDQYITHVRKFFS